MSKHKPNPARETELPQRPEDTTLDRLGGRHSETTGDTRDDSSSAGDASDTA